MLWIDKYRPRHFDNLVINQEVGRNLQNLVSGGDCPHLLFYGPPGAGKKTLIGALLTEIYGPGAEKIHIVNKSYNIQLPSRNIEVELTLSSSNFHVELNPSDAGFNDRYVVQEIIKEMAKSRPLDSKGQKGFKVLVLNEVDRISREAQHSLRRTMEKYSSACRLVMVCNNLSKVIDPVRSRCLCIRISAPTTDDILHMMQHVATKEGITIPEQLQSRLVQVSQRNLRRSLLMLEACRVAQCPLKATMELPLPDWELFIKEIASSILKEQTPKQLYVVRGMLNELLVNCLPPEILLRKLCQELNQRVDDPMRHNSVKAAADCEVAMQEGSKSVIHLEAFVARFMSDYKVHTMLR